MKNLLFLLGLILGSLLAQAQTSEFEQDMSKLLEINGSSANYDLIYEQLISQYKMMKPNVPQETWDALKQDVYDKEIESLYKEMMPLYQKYFTHDDIKQLIEFFSSPIGQKLTEGTTKIGEESMQLTQTWGMELGAKLNTYLSENGF